MKTEQTAPRALPPGAISNSQFLILNLKFPVLLALLVLTAGVLSIHTARANFDGPYAFFGYPGPYTNSTGGPCGPNWVFFNLPGSTLTASPLGQQAQISVSTGAHGSLMLMARMFTNGVFQFAWQVNGMGLLPECGFWSNGVHYPFQIAGPSTSTQGTFSSHITTNDMCG